mmetsp:Transcript_25435/g.76935  ORF Transcript_25435/g.76935 Transcript_25435/m.76935 type:complete len:272 (+) Transcript_25435:880-1695(+)
MLEVAAELGRRRRVRAALRGVAAARGSRLAQLAQHESREVLARPLAHRQPGGAWTAGRRKRLATRSPADTVALHAAAAAAASWQAGRRLRRKRRSVSRGDDGVKVAADAVRRLDGPARTGRSLALSRVGHARRLGAKERRQRRAGCRRGGSVREDATCERPHRRHSDEAICCGGARAAEQTKDGVVAVGGGHASDKGAGTRVQLAKRPFPATHKTGPLPRLCQRPHLGMRDGERLRAVVKGEVLVRVRFRQRRPPAAIGRREAASLTVDRA